MKVFQKVLAMCLLALLLFSFSACGCDHKIVIDEAVAATCTTDGLSEGEHCELCEKVLKAQETIPATGHKKVTVEAKEATCTSDGQTKGEKCSVCYAVLSGCETVAAKGHTTTTGTCSRCGESFGIFETSYYVDEFKQPTSDGYVYGAVIGTFSNSATTNSVLGVGVLVDTKNITFVLLEYGSHQVKNNSSRYVDEYSIVMKTADGKKHNLTGTMYCGGDRIYIDDAYKTTVLKALKSGKTVSFYIVNDDYTTTTYLFSVDTSNFAEEYQKLVG